MGVFLVLGVGLLTLWLVDRAGALIADGAVIVLARGLYAWARTLDSWPHGVQEEDRDRPWGRGRATRNARPQPNVKLNRVRPIVHGR